MCKNGAICIKSKDGQDYYCQCPKYFCGPTCESVYCDIECDPNYGKCVKNNQCECLVEHKHGEFCNETRCPDRLICKNGGVCNVVKNELYCICNLKMYGGKYCEKTCTPSCVNGICVSIEVSVNKVYKLSLNSRKILMMFDSIISTKAPAELFPS
ncbi:Teneurin-4 [Thelohanellus kitauei]|uniref:Teneurin-4 n=1 Tax=Thelohanellus kitauei TaxID=669202 RepID=A0A0C2J0V3_THEKT|nr:Teneurin-4 [Thelohanellus kitauei]